MSLFRRRAATSKWSGVAVLIGGTAFVVLSLGVPEPGGCGGSIPNRSASLSRQAQAVGSGTGQGLPRPPALVHWRNKWGSGTAPSGAGQSNRGSVLSFRALLGSDSADGYLAVNPPAGVSPPADGHLNVRAFDARGKLLGEAFHSRVPFVTAVGQAPNVCGSPSFSEATWGRGLSLQAHAVFDNGRQSDEAAATTVVGFRPELDLQVTSAGEGHPNVPINVTATITERLRDNGADVRLVARDSNGELLDGTSHPVWVAPGASADIAMSLVFTTSGQHQVTVSLEDECPADYDPNGLHSHKVAQFAVNISSSSLIYSLSGWSLQSGINDVGSGNFVSSPTAGTLGQWNFTNATTGMSEGNSFTGILAQYTPFPLDRVHLRTTSGTNLIEERILEGIPEMVGTHTATYDYSAAWYWFPETSSSIYLYSYRNTAGSSPSQATVVTHTRSAGSVTYFSTGSQTWWGGTTTNLSESFVANYGVPVHLPAAGEVLSEIATLSSGTQIYGGLSETTTETPVDMTWGYHYCWTYDWTGARVDPVTNQLAATAGCLTSTGFTKGVLQTGAGNTQPVPSPF